MVFVEKQMAKQISTKELFEFMRRLYNKSRLLLRSIVMNVRKKIVILFLVEPVLQTASKVSLRVLCLRVNVLLLIFPI